MRILWFTNTPSCFKSENGGYNGGGWISSLEKEIKKLKDIELAICFHSNDNKFKISQNRAIYYPIYVKKNKFKDLFFTFSQEYYEKTDYYYIEKYLEVINDFKPDIINIFGSESNFGLISLYTEIPIILHIQGILTPYLTAFYPPGYSHFSELFNSINPIKIAKDLKNYKYWKYRTNREQLIFSNIPYFMGRTEWDKRITNIYAPNSQYFHCDEILRDNFYTPLKNIKSNNNKLIITSTISSPLYKGFDTILQAAHILKNNLRVDFEWNVYGIKSIKSYEKKFKINAKENNIFIKGIVTEQILSQKLIESTMFVHPSYIDNSPNSICESQILGCPVIATNVGGIPSLIENYVDGLLIPTNDPYQMAYLIKELSKNQQLRQNISKKGIENAEKRHNKTSIINNLLNIYKTIIYKANYGI